MLWVRAYSFRQKSRLAISLSWIGGYIDIIGVLAMGTVVSHVTGSMTQFAQSVGARSAAQVLFFGWLLLTFLAGAMLSAVVTEIAKRHGWRSKFILPIALEAILLSILAVALSRLPAHGQVLYIVVGLASLAMGLQNATITKISGAVVRTTHLTGIFTDLGLESVHYLFWFRDRQTGRGWERARRLLRISRRHPHAERTLLLASIAGSFGLGALVGFILYHRLGAAALGAPIAFLLWIVYVDLRTPIAAIREMDRLNDPELKLHDLVDQLLPRGIMLYRFGNGTHAPNFQLWLDRVPEDCRVVVLAVSPQTQFDANAILDLETAVQKLHEHGQLLVISGMMPNQFKALDGMGIARSMDMNNICPDLEFAIARAIALVSSREDALGHPIISQSL